MLKYLKDSKVNWILLDSSIQKGPKLIKIGKTSIGVLFYIVLAFLSFLVSGPSFVPPSCLVPDLC